MDALATKPRWIRTCVVTLMLALTAQAVLAQTLRERIAERRVQQQSETLEDENDDASRFATVPEGVQVVRDVAYGPDEEQRFDVYLPRRAMQNAPVILMVHGGGGDRGDKTMRSVVQNKVAHWVGKGFVFISTNYRLLPKAGPLEQADDIARALAAAQRRAASWGGDASRFILMGHSAGSHLVALVSAAPDRAYRLGASRWLGSVLLDGAALDVPQFMRLPHASLFDKAFGSDPLYWRRASPYHQLSAGAPPMLAVCSTRRGRACPEAHHFAAGAAALGVPVRVSEQDLSHREINMLLGEEGAYTDTVDAFIRAVLRQ